MKIEYLESVIGQGIDLIIKGADFAKCLTEKGTIERQNLAFVLKSYCCATDSVKLITIRDIEEAYRHCGSKGKIIITTKSAEYLDRVVMWNNIYCSLDDRIIPVLTSEDGVNFKINRSAKTEKEITKWREDL